MLSTTSSSLRLCYCTEMKMSDVEDSVLRGLDRAFANGPASKERCTFLIVMELSKLSKDANEDW
jgi:hypothetical protein